MGNNTPKISVLMAAYNAEKYIAESIESILNQTFINFEFIIVNDGSTDQTVDIINSYKERDSRVVLLNNKLKKGVSGAANTGLAEAKGIYIARMDSDDVSLPDRLQEQVSFMDRNLDVGVCGTWTKLFGIHDKVWKNPVTDDQIKSTMFYHGAIANPSSMIRASVLKENKLEYNYVIAEDYDLFVRISRVSKLANLPRVLLKYRTHTTNIGTVQVVEQNESANLVRKTQLEYLGVDYSEHEWKLHLDICYGNYHNDLKYLEDAYTWINKLIQVNGTRNVYNKKIFEKVSYNIWIDLYRNSNKLDFSRIINLYGKVSLSQLIDLNLAMGKNVFKRILSLV